MDPIWMKSYPLGVKQQLPKSRYDNLLDFFDHQFQSYSQQTAFSNMGQGLSYKEADKYSRRFAIFLQEDLGLKKGERFAIMMPNLLQYPIAVLGALRAGLVIVNVNPLYTARELSHLLKDSEAKAILILENFAHTLEACLSDSSLEHIVLTSIGDMLPQPKRTLVNFVVRQVKKMVPAYKLSDAIAFKSSLKASNTEYRKPEISGDDLAFLQYTGGTTGRSKGAMLSHRNLIANTEQFLAWISSDPDVLTGNLICPLPLYHIFALMLCLFGFLSAGCESVLITNPRDMKNFLKVLAKRKFNGIIGVNTLFKGLLAQKDFAKIDFSGLRLALGGGMAIERSVAERWKKATGAPLMQAYGLTEASPAVTANPIDAEAFNGSIGLPLPATEVSIRDDRGKEVAVGQAGEIWVRGPQIFSGYWRNPEETAKVLADGWLKTGDIAKFDANGFVYILDRKKDMILVSGFNVYPNEIEDVVCSHRKVMEAAAISVPDKRTGEAVKLFVVKADDSLSKDELIAYCRKNLTPYKVPKILEWRSDLPKSPVGKILRKDLRNNLQSSSQASC